MVKQIIITFLSEVKINDEDAFTLDAKRLGMI